MQNYLLKSYEGNKKSQRALILNSAYGRRNAKEEQPPELYSVDMNLHGNLVVDNVLI